MSLKAAAGTIWSRAVTAAMVTLATLAILMVILIVIFLIGLVALKLEGWAISEWLGM